MIWIILTFVFGWLLCSAWAIRMTEKYSGCIEDHQWLFYTLGPISLIITWFVFWPKRLWKISKTFIQGVESAWDKAKNEKH